VRFTVRLENGPARLRANFAAHCRLEAERSNNANEVASVAILLSHFERFGHPACGNESRIIPL
jgi:hypothetical protein